VPDPKGIFGTTLGLEQKFGSRRVLDMPCAENGMTGVAIGSALAGMRPVMVHQRIDFAILAMEQLTNQAAKWHYMFGGKMTVPIVVRLVVGRGWGQGPQHSQSLQSWFAHVPGLKVVMPTTPHDAKGLLIASIEDNNPVIFIEHRWLHNLSGPVPEGYYRTPLSQCRIAHPGADVTIVATAYAVVDALRATESLALADIHAEVIDVRTLAPLDEATIIQSVEKTGRLIVCDTGWRHCGFAAEVVARVVEQPSIRLKCPPHRITLPDCPTPTSSALSESFYPQPWDIENAARQMIGLPDVGMEHWQQSSALPLDVPDTSFKGPF
jgi:pyruvate dehydrogenase E1 component beta subunit